MGTYDPSGEPVTYIVGDPNLKHGDKVPGRESKLEIQGHEVDMAAIRKMRSGEDAATE